ncbi:hypothetical protein E2C01_012806 [Portunus trituberculatus]|uniref:Secreted protein n=1 Tax=Portunus trituberculatus TaxID=210409 RepID=A0A5B7DFN8_PORTR|nr:hypothetical protein [Portunus trituberculatus]
MMVLVVAAMASLVLMVTMVHDLYRRGMRRAPYYTRTPPDTPHTTTNILHTQTHKLTSCGEMEEVRVVVVLVMVVVVMVAAEGLWEGREGVGAYVPVVVALLGGKGKGGGRLSTPSRRGSRQYNSGLPRNACHNLRRFIATLSIEACCSW